VNSVANRDQCSSEPAVQPSEASLQALTPPGWDESAGFRETFLYHVTDPEDLQTHRRLARLLYESSLEMARYAPPGGESATREELRAAAADLRHLQGFLASVARSLEESELSPADAELAALAAQQAHAVAGLAVTLEQAFG
jgi:hypothetical protein